MHKYTCACVCVCVRAYVCVHMCVCVHAHASVHGHVFVHTCMLSVVWSSLLQLFLSIYVYMYKQFFLENVGRSSVHFL